MTDRKPGLLGRAAAGEVYADFRRLKAASFARRAAEAFGGRVSVLPNAAVRRRCRRLSAQADGPVRLSVERVSDRATVYALSYAASVQTYVGILAHDAVTFDYPTRAALDADIAAGVV